MANRPVFLVDEQPPYFKEVNVDFEFFSGFAPIQKQKSIESLHNAYIDKYGKCNILEVSRRSKNEIGIKLSAFNLKLKNLNSGETYPIECIFQSSKKFKNGGPYRDLLNVFPGQAKKDERLKTSGELISFEYDNISFPLMPKTLFYDWIYLNALLQNDDFAKELIKYDAFTDIEFNPKKSINCQARSTAIFVSLYRKNMLQDVLSNINKFKCIYNEEEYEQLGLF